jgi:branched-chain amino acid transport system permease protein
MSLQIWIDGIFAGSVFAIIALSMTIVYQPTRIMNFAQGEGFILGAALGYQFIGVWHWPLIKVIPAVILCAVLMALIMERMIMLPVQLSGSKFAWIIATLAAALIFQSLFNIKWVNVTFGYFDFVDKNISIAGGKLSIQKLIVIIFMFVVYAANELFLKKTLWGRSIRAIAHNPDTSTILGIPTKPVIKMGFIVGTVVIALVGFLAAPVIIVAPAAGLYYTIQGFTAGIIGGVGSAKGAVVGGLTIGILDSVVRSWLGGTWGLFSTFFVLALILVLRPNGFFGKRVEGR